MGISYYTNGSMNGSAYQQGVYLSGFFNLLLNFHSEILYINIHMNKTKNLKNSINKVY